MEADDLQRDLRTVIESGAARSLYQPSYSMISNPMGPLRHQNSNHWVLDVIAQAQNQAAGEYAVSRAATQQTFLAGGYRPSKIAISGFERFGAALTRANVRFDDHPQSSEHSGRYDVVSVKSINDYLASANLLHRSVEFLDSGRANARRVPTGLTS